MFGKKKSSDLPPSNGAKNEENSKSGKEKVVKKKGNTKEVMQVIEPTSSGEKKRKFLSKKLIFVLLLLIAIGVSAFVVYKIYFTKKSVDTTIQKVYVKKKLPHVTLPEDLIRFSYDFIPDVYDSMVIFNGEVMLLENEIKRLAELGKQFPDQIKITEKEIKVWEKEKNKLTQTYEKLQKRVEALYVSYRVNQEAGIQQIEEQKGEITQTAKEALTPALDLTKRLKIVPEEKIPEGFINGTIYKIKDKINKLIKR